MHRKLAYKYRKFVFAGAMSFTTAIIVSGAISYLHAPPGADFPRIWLGAVAMAWPIVFVAILTIAPLVDQLVSRFVEPH